MSNAHFSSWVSWLLFLFFAVAGGVMSSWVFWNAVLAPRIDEVATRIERTVSNATSTLPAFEVPRIRAGAERRPLTPASLLRRRSSVAVILGRVTTPRVGERELGNAVALTSDGWFLATGLGGVRLADLSLRIEEKTYPVTKGIRDTATGFVYLKTAATNQVSADVARADDAVAGMAVFFEPKAKRFYPDTLVDIRQNGTSTNWSSETATRRFLIASEAQTLWMGTPVWDEEGRLVGMLEERTNEGWRVIPASNALPALEAVFGNREIRHASLGIRMARATSSIAEGLAQGSVVVTEKKTALLSAPAAPFQVGDVIERLERDILDGTADLGERLLAYRPGAQVTFYGRRQSVPMEWVVTLGTATSSEMLK